MEGYEIEVYLRDGRRIDSPRLDLAGAKEELAALNEVINTQGVKVERPWLVVDQGHSIVAVAMRPY